MASTKTGHTIPELVFGTDPHDTPAVISSTVSVSLSQDKLKEASLAAASTILSLYKHDFIGIDGQPVVSLALPNGLGFVLAFLGVVSRGAVVAPLNPAYTIPEYEVRALNFLYTLAQELITYISSTLKTQKLASL